MPVVRGNYMALRLRALTGISFNLHDLRRGASSGMSGLGVTQDHIDEVLNHKKQGQGKVYNVYNYDSEKRSALLKWENTSWSWSHPHWKLDWKFPRQTLSNPLGDTCCPQEGEMKLLTYHQVRKMVPVGRTTLWRWEKAGQFPQRVQIGPKLTGWRESDIHEWSAPPWGSRPPRWCASKPRPNEGRQHCSRAERQLARRRGDDVHGGQPA